MHASFVLWYWYAHRILYYERGTWEKKGRRALILWIGSRQDDRMIGIRSQKILLRVQTFREAHTASRLISTSFIFADTTVGKWSCNHWPASGVEVKTGWRHNANLPYVLVAYCLIKHNVNFIAAVGGRMKNYPLISALMDKGPVTFTAELFLWHLPISLLSFPYLPIYISLALSLISFTWA